MFYTLGHLRRVDKAEWQGVIFVENRRSHETLASLHVSNQSIQQGLICWGMVLGERPEILAPITLPGWTREIEGQQRSSILLRHSDQHGACWRWVARLERPEPIDRCYTSDLAYLELRRSLGLAQPRGLSSPPQNLGIDLGHLVFA